MHALRRALRLTGAALALAASACAYDSTVEVGMEPVGADASVRGSITYRERIALTPDAVVTIQLRDTSYADAASVLIAEQIISNPGQVPIDFNVRYVSDEIDDRNTYSIAVVITEGDGRMAFTNDTAYDVITRGNPRHVDMTLVMVEPPPELVPDGWNRTDSQRVEAPVHATDVHMIWEGSTGSQNSGYLRVAFATSSQDGCYHQGREEAARDESGNGVQRYKVTVAARVPAPEPWAQDCSERDLELDAIVHLGNGFISGETFEVVLNDERTFTFTAP
ncbi:YbaY family lipoprotein [Candidatus Poriferisodalis sp.]|uniref:YbaY family lipoprotein n=1 Tax=Candidatus Poriferisodalis sp. TaxID=3101277 RepID=UPI003AF547A6